MATWSRPVTSNPLVSRFATVDADVVAILARITSRSVSTFTASWYVPEPIEHQVARLGGVDGCLDRVEVLMTRRIWGPVAPSLPQPTSAAALGAIPRRPARARACTAPFYPAGARRTEPEPSGSDWFGACTPAVLATGRRGGGRRAAAGAPPGDRSVPGPRSSFAMLALLVVGCGSADDASTTTTTAVRSAGSKPTERDAERLARMLSDNHRAGGASFTASTDYSADGQRGPRRRGGLVRRHEVPSPQRRPSPMAARRRPKTSSTPRAAVYTQAATAQQRTVLAQQGHAGVRWIRRAPNIGGRPLDQVVDLMASPPDPAGQPSTRGPR